MAHQQGVTAARAHSDHEDLEKCPQIMSSDRGRIKHCMGFFKKQIDTCNQNLNTHRQVQEGRLQG